MRDANGGYGHQKTTNEISFQVRTMDAPHTCIPFRFKLAKRHMSCDLLADTYRETFRLKPALRDVDLKSIVKEKHN